MHSFQDPYDLFQIHRRQVAVRVNLVNPEAPHVDEYLMKAVRDLSFQSMVSSPVERYLKASMGKQLLRFGPEGPPARRIPQGLLKEPPPEFLRRVEDNKTFRMYVEGLNRVRGDLMSTPLGMAYSENKDAVRFFGSMLAVAGVAGAFYRKGSALLNRSINGKEFKILDAGHLKLDVTPRLDPSHGKGGGIVHAEYRLKPCAFEGSLDFDILGNKLTRGVTEGSVAVDLGPRTNLKLSNETDWFGKSSEIGLDAKQHIGPKSILSAGVKTDYKLENWKIALGLERGQLSASLAFQPANSQELIGLNVGLSIGRK
jgi:hypothetical protein